MVDTRGLEERIRSAAWTVYQDIAGSDERVSRGLANRGHRYLIINSSFLLRDKRLLKTTQSSHRLVLTVTKNASEPTLTDVGVVDGLQIKGHYHMENSLQDVTPLSEAVHREVRAFGDVLFVLLGQTQGSPVVEEPVNSSSVSCIRFDTQSSSALTTSPEGTVIIRDIVPIEDLFSKVEEELAGDTQKLTEDERRSIAKAYDTLLEKVVLNVTVPSPDQVNKDETLLGQIIASTRGHVNQYREALKGLDAGRDSSLNEVLRIAYNFASDAIPLLLLFMSVCDLKPLVFWCTVDRHWELQQAFASLPWSQMGRKERMIDYRDIIAGARNRAFHHVLPFDRTVEVDLANLDVRAERMRLFAPYGEKQSRGLYVRDQELIEVLSDFSRAKERPVSVEFWKSNLAVMDATANFGDAVLDTLMALWRIRQDK